MVHGFYLISVTLRELFQCSNKAGTNVSHGQSAAAESLHRWLALRKLPPCQPPGEQILLCAENEVNSLLIFIVGKSLFSPWL